MKKWKILLAFGMASLFQTTAYGAEAEISFGTDAYEKECGDAFFIGVYSKSDETMEKSDIVLTYDTRYLEYEAGATSESEKGTLHIVEDEATKEGKCLIRFKVLAVGESDIKVSNANILTKEGQPFTVETLPSTKVVAVSANPNTIENITINGVAIENFNKDIYTYALNAPFAEMYEINATGAGSVTHQIVDISTTEKRLDIMPVLTTGEAYVYSVTLTEPQIEEESTTQKETIGEELIESQTVSLIEVEPQTEAVAEGLMENIEEQRKDEMKRAVLILVVGAALMSLVVFCVVQLRER